MPEAQPGSMTVRRLIGVYNAHGTVIGELAAASTPFGSPNRQVIDVAPGREQAFRSPSLRIHRR